MLGNALFRTHSQRNWVRGLLLLFLVGTVYFLWFRPDRWKFRNKLPRTAQDVHEWFWSPGFIPDYNYHLKAKVSAPQFKHYVSRFSLTPHSPARTYSESADLWLRWEDDDCGEKWWDPSDKVDGTYVEQEHDTWTFAKYENGYLYLTSLNH